MRVHFRSSSGAALCSWITYLPRGSRSVRSPRARLGSPGSRVVADLLYEVPGSRKGVIVNPAVPVPPTVTLSMTMAPFGMNLFTNVQAAPSPASIVTSTLLVRRRGRLTPTVSPLQNTRLRRHSPARLLGSRSSILYLPGPSVSGLGSAATGTFGSSVRARAFAVG